jgi:hypothetical protein
MIADHQDDRQAPQEIDLPDAPAGAVHFSHGVRILWTKARRQGNAGGQQVRYHNGRQKISTKLITEIGDSTFFSEFPVRANAKSWEMGNKW